jgi:hypothetical protein
MAMFLDAPGDYRRRARLTRQWAFDTFQEQR